VLAGSGDLIDALAGLGGVTIRVRHELPEPSMRLMRTLDVTVIVDPENGEPCVKFAGKHNTGLKHDGCRKCGRMKQRPWP
jgi:hypothetical protein